MCGCNKKNAAPQRPAVAPRKAVAQGAAKIKWVRKPITRPPDLTLGGSAEASMSRN